GSVTAARRATRAGAGLLFDSLVTPVRVRQLVDAYRSDGGRGPCVLVRRAWLGDPPIAEFERQVAVYRDYAGAAPTRSGTIRQRVQRGCATRHTRLETGSAPRRSDGGHRARVGKLCNLVFPLGTEHAQWCRSDALCIVGSGAAGVGNDQENTMIRKKTAQRLT